MNALTQLVRRGLRRFGVDVIRHRSLNTSLAHHGINVVLDVGANTGQYGTALRALGFRGRIVSFEPQKSPFSQLAAVAARDGNWQAVNLGLGMRTDRAKSTFTQIRPWARC